MDSSTCWNIVLSILSFLLACISVGVALKTLKQNSKMIEESTRPSLSLLFFNDGALDIVLKNTGKSDAIIKSISHDMVFNKTYGYYPFKNCEGVVIAPNQCIHYVEDYQNFCDKNDDTIHFKVEYRSNAGKCYCLDQEYSILGLRNQSYLEKKIDNDNAEIIQAKGVYKIYRLLRYK